MKLTWKKKKASSGNKRSRPYPNLPFDDNEELEVSEQKSADIIKIDKVRSDIFATDSKTVNPSDSDLAESFLSQGNQLAEDGRYREALMKWEAALTLMPERAVLYEQKAQVLLEIGDAWNALRAATRATELEPSWAEAWITLARAQLNYGEPDSSLESFDRALAIKPDSEEAQIDRQTALKLVKRRKQLHGSGVTSVTETRYKVGDKAEVL
ncbi:uncharacterized protein LOC131236566 [Magnolia sinica]|uniref:uncharacterized protein LOC131236566 n=1 Tax=Magnolia sinica TaxID=86752 RepID=UPI00265A09DE|nr:uncharacterized protein LOC131236566 [Magnolia sinica]